MLPCCLLLTSAAINFVVNLEYFLVDTYLSLLYSGAVVCIFCFIIPTFPSLRSSALPFSVTFTVLFLGCSFPASAGNSHPWVSSWQAADSLHMHPLCEILPSNAHNNKPVAVMFHACLSCSGSVLYWCSPAWLLCFLSHLFVAVTLCVFPLFRTLPPRGCHHSQACSAFSILTCIEMGASLPFLPSATERQMKLMCFKTLKKIIQYSFMGCII